MTTGGSAGQIGDLDEDDAVSTAEFRARQDRLQTSLAQQGLDGVLLCSQESMYYYFGYDQIGYWVFQTVLVTPGGDPVAICRAADAYLVRASGLLADVRIWLDDELVGPIDLTIGAIKERGGIKRLGLESDTHALLPTYHAELLDRVGLEVELVDVSTGIVDLRLVKSATEIASCRRAGHALTTAFAAASHAIRVGARETDIESEVMAAMLGAGGESPALPPPIASGERTLGQTHTRASRRRLAHGDVVTVEIGASVNRYHVVGAVSRIVGGGGTPSQRRLHAGLVAGLDAGRPHLAAGVEAATVAEAVQAELRHAGISRAGRHVGYGTGIGFPPNWLDSLRLKATDPHRLAAGMVLFYFVGAVDDSERFAMYVGYPLLVTDAGHELLAEVPTELSA